MIECDQFESEVVFVRIFPLVVLSSVPSEVRFKVRL